MNSDGHTLLRPCMKPALVAAMVTNKLPGAIEQSDYYL